MGAFRCQQRQQRQQRHDCHVLEQQDGERTLAVVLLQLAAFFQDLQRDGGRRHCQCQTSDNGSAPVDETNGIAKRADGERGKRQLGRAEAEYGTAHG